MTQEDKELLLLKDLCARLPYGVKVSKIVEDWTSDPRPIRSINLNNIIVVDGEFEDGTPDIDVWGYEDFKPYLFPLSSMTEEQYESFIIVSGWDGDYEDIKRGKFSCVGYIGIDYIYDTIDWFIKNHFDYRGLIPKGIALDATGLNIY